MVFVMHTSSAMHMKLCAILVPTEDDTVWTDVADLATLASCTIFTGGMLPFTVLHLRLVALLMVLPNQEICCQLQHGDGHRVILTYTSVLHS